MDNTKKTKVIMGVSIGVIVLVLIFGLVLGIIHAKSQNLTSDTNAVPDKDQINTVGNTPANLMHGGLATTQGDKIYYINGNSVGRNRIMVMDWDGENEQELCTLEGELSGINVIGDQLFFFNRIYDGDPYVGASCISSSIYCLNLNSLSLTEVYYFDNYLSELFVIENKMYFSAESEGEIFSANIDGSDVTCIIEKGDYLSGFSIYGNKIYYFVGFLEIPLCCCDLDGSNEKSLSFVSGPCSYDIVNSKIYYSAIEEDALASVVDTVYCNVVYSMNLDGTQKNEVLKSEGNHGIGSLNIVNNVLYYFDSTDTYVDPGTESYHYEINAKKINGSTKKLGEIDNWINEPAICGNWLFYYDTNKNETVKIKL